MRVLRFHWAFLRKKIIVRYKGMRAIKKKSVQAQSNWRCLCVVSYWMDGHWTHSINVDLSAAQRGQSPSFPSSAKWMCSLPSRAVTYFSSRKVCLNCKVEARLTRHSTQRADTAADAMRKCKSHFSVPCATGFKMISPPSKRRRTR